MFPTRGRVEVKVEPKSDSCHQCLRHICTEGVLSEDGNPTYSAFPMAAKCLIDWVSDFTDDEEETANQTPRDILTLPITEEIEEKMNELQDGSDLLNNTLSEIVKAATKRMQMLKHDIFRLVQSWLSIAVPPILTFLLTNYTLVYGNTRTKVDFALQLAGEQIKDWKNVLKSAVQQIEE